MFSKYSSLCVADKTLFRKTNWNPDSSARSDVSCACSTTLTTLKICSLTRRADGDYRRAAYSRSFEHEHGRLPSTNKIKEEVGGEKTSITPVLTRFQGYHSIDPNFLYKVSIIDDIDFDTPFKLTDQLKIDTACRCVSLSGIAVRVTLPFPSDSLTTALWIRHNSPSLLPAVTSDLMDLFQTSRAITVIEKGKRDHSHFHLHTDLNDPNGLLTNRSYQRAIGKVLNRPPGQTVEEDRDHLFALIRRIWTKHLPLQVFESKVSSAPSFMRHGNDERNLHVDVSSAYNDPQLNWSYLAKSSQKFRKYINYGPFAGKRIAPKSWYWISPDLQELVDNASTSQKLRFYTRDSVEHFIKQVQEHIPLNWADVPNRYTDTVSGIELDAIETRKSPADQLLLQTGLSNLIYPSEEFIDPRPVHIPGECSCPRCNRHGEYHLKVYLNVVSWRCRLTWSRHRRKKVS